jgi:hypothetical protein
VASLKWTEVHILERLYFWRPFVKKTLGSTSQDEVASLEINLIRLVCTQPPSNSGEVGRRSSSPRHPTSPLRRHGCRSSFPSAARKVEGLAAVDHLPRDHASAVDLAGLEANTDVRGTLPAPWSPSDVATVLPRRRPTTPLVRAGGRSVLLSSYTLLVGG